MPQLNPQQISTVLKSKRYLSIICRPNLNPFDNQFESKQLLKPKHIDNGFAVPINYAQLVKQQSAMSGSSNVDLVSLANWESVEVIDLTWISSG
jgi:hypothetical protein